MRARVRCMLWGLVPDDVAGSRLCIQNRALRSSPEIERIVYVSCNHTAWVEQARALCCPGEESSRTPGEVCSVFVICSFVRAHATCVLF